MPSDLGVGKAAVPTFRPPFSGGTEVSLANLLWAVALVQLSPPEVHPVLHVHDKVFQEAKRVELIRLLWALGVRNRVREFSICMYLFSLKTEDDNLVKFPQDQCMP